MFLTNKTALFLTPVLSLILCSCTIQNVGPITQFPKDIAVNEVAQPQECTDTRVNSGWFIEKDGYCYFDKRAAISDLKGTLDSAEQKNRDIDTEKPSAEQKNTILKDDAEWDICFGPVIPADKDWYVACSECMCCIVISGKIYCGDRPTVNAPVIVR
ncbi:hypothetical protein [Desulfopila inferna]|uniref:hypothetical protein n=1 Tax=Desulfopila inferna TaxID=468528 RepID=UPI001964E4E1|nr:hypothetical protein [Desulfopila inferna]